MGANLCNSVATSISDTPAPRIRGRVPAPADGGDEFKISGETFVPKIPANALFSVDKFDDEGSFLGIE